MSDFERLSELVCLAKPPVKGSEEEIEWLRGASGYFEQLDQVTLYVHVDLVSELHRHNLQRLEQIEVERELLEIWLERAASMVQRQIKGFWEQDWIDTGDPEHPEFKLDDEWCIDGTLPLDGEVQFRDLVQFYCDSHDFRRRLEIGNRLLSVVKQLYKHKKLLPQDLNLQIVKGILRLEDDYIAKVILRNQ